MSAGDAEIWLACPERIKAADWSESPTEHPEYQNCVAYQYYTRAMMRISYIGTILQGEIPEGDNITVYETNVSNELIDKIAE